jgi:hypothetical protein
LDEGEYVSKVDVFGARDSPRQRGRGVSGLQRPAAACSGAIGEFETIINSDAETGNLNRGVYRRIVSELGAVKANCSGGRDAEATRALTAIKSRHGNR